MLLYAFICFYLFMIILIYLSLPLSNIFVSAIKTSKSDLYNLSCFNLNLSYYLYASSFAILADILPVLCNISLPLNCKKAFNFFIQSFIVIAL